MIEDYKGKKHRILLFESNFIIVEVLKTELVQRNDNYYVFIFSALNFINGEKRKTYVIVRKSIDEVEDLIRETVHGINRNDTQFR